MVSSNAPIKDEVVRITNAVVDALGTADLESALTVVCNIGGQLVAALSDGKPSAIREHAKSLTENIMRAAIAKVLHDDTQRRKAEEAPES